MFQHLYGDVYYWTECHGKPETIYDWNSCAIRIDSANVFALVDPLPLTAREIRQIEEIGTPTHILLTCNWHLREGEIFRERWGCKIYLNALGLTEAETRIDGTFEGGDRLWDAIEVIHLPHSGWGEETAFLVKQEQGTSHRREMRYVADGQTLVSRTVRSVSLPISLKLFRTARKHEIRWWV